MFSVSADIYEILSLAARYLFAIMGLLIVVRAFLWLLSDRKERKDRLRRLPDAGKIGEFVVLAGSRDLPENTWIPVPREGVLGSVRSCDLVIPCPGVRSGHLDFSWLDGTGLLIRPRSGCEARVDGIPLNCRSNPRSAPLRHGSFLEVGTARLRLLVFAGLDPNAGFEDLPEENAAPQPEAAAAETPGTFAYVVPEVPPQIAFVPYAGPEPGVLPAQDSPLNVPGAEALPPDSPDPAPQAAPEPRRRRADRWKEDWSE